MNQPKPQLISVDRFAEFFGERGRDVPDDGTLPSVVTQNGVDYYRLCDVAHLMRGALRGVGFSFDDVSYH